MFDDQEVTGTDHRRAKSPRLLPRALQLADRGNQSPRGTIAQLAFLRYTRAAPTPEGAEPMKRWSKTARLLRGLVEEYRQSATPDDEWPQSAATQLLTINDCGRALGLSDDELGFVLGMDGLSLVLHTLEDRP